MIQVKKALLSPGSVNTGSGHTLDAPGCCIGPRLYQESAQLLLHFPGYPVGRELWKTSEHSTTSVSQSRVAGVDCQGVKKGQDSVHPHISSPALADATLGDRTLL